MDQVDSESEERQPVADWPRLMVFGPVSPPLEATDLTRVLRIDSTAVCEVAADHAELLPALLFAGQQDADKEGRVSSRSMNRTWTETRGLGVPA